MFRVRPPALVPCAFVLFAIASAFICSAQPGQSQTPGAAGASTKTLKLDLVKTGLFLISGGGGNTLLRLSGNGLLLIDGKSAGSYAELRHSVNRIAELPIRLVVNTSHFEDHTGTNAKFLADGVPVMAQENVAKNLEDYHPAGEKIAAPSVAYKDEQTLHFGLVQARLLHFGRARTDGDTVVYFPDLKVVAVGDLYAATPNPDYAAGGSLVGWSSVLSQILELDFNVAVPGEGPTISRADLEAYKTKIDTLVSRAQELVKKGVPKDQLMGQLKTDDLGWFLNFTGPQLDGFYAELSQAKQAIVIAN